MKMLIKKFCKYLTEASNNHKVSIFNSSNIKNIHHDQQSHLLFKLNMKCGGSNGGYLHQHQLHLHTVKSSYYSFITVLCVISVVLLLPLCCVDAVGYSYTRFVGPVAGPEHRIYVNDAGNVQDAPAVAGNDASSRLDYVAKPEYEFSYGVEDAESHILHNRNEMRDGDAVKGVYSVVDPDGTLRVVKYTADEANGFQAEVITNGVSTLYGQPPKDGATAKTHNNNNYYNNYQTQLKDEVNHPNFENHHAQQLQQPPQTNHYYPHIQYPTAPPPIIYFYNNNYDDNNDDGDIDSDSESGNKDGYQPQYEVREKENENGNDNKNDGNDHEDGAGGGGDGGNDDGEGANKKKGNKGDTGDTGNKGDTNKENSDEDYDDDDDDSEELEDYDEAARSNEASDESFEYY